MSTITSCARRRCRQRRPTRLKFGVLTLLATLSVVAAPAVRATDFFHGKNLRIIVPYPPGGGYDRYARIIATHLGDHIPGLAGVVVENKSGAGGLVALNHLLSVTRPDGLTLTMTNPNLALEQRLQRNKSLPDVSEIIWLGAPTTGQIACYIMARTGLKSLTDITSSPKPAAMAATRPGNLQTDIPLILNKIMSNPFSLVLGYKGSSNINLALLQGEVEGVCAPVDTMHATARNLLDDEGADRLVPFLSVGVPDLEAYPMLGSLPRVPDIIADPDARAALALYVKSRYAYRAFVAPPGVPPDRVEALRAALSATLSDPSFLAAAREANLRIKPVSGAETEQVVADIYHAPASEIETLKRLLQPSP